jgi:uncharacterized protein YjbJ (UPF0337 family)
LQRGRLPADEPGLTEQTDLAGVLIGAFTSWRIEIDWNRIEGNWKQVKGKVKQQWGKLTDDDLDVIAGKQDQLEGKIQQRYGYHKDQAK